MHDELVIEGCVVLQPAEFNNNWKNTIVDKVKSKYLGCTEKYGYIIDILQISNEIDTKLDSNTTMITCNIIIKVLRIKPEKHKVISCKVQMIFNNGIFAQIDDKIKILVPNDVLKIDNYMFQKTTNKYYNNDTKQTISKNDVINVMITDLQYSKNKYNCIGNMH